MRALIAGPQGACAATEQGHLLIAKFFGRNPTRLMRRGLCVLAKFFAQNLTKKFHVRNFGPIRTVRSGIGNAGREKRLA